MSHALRHDPRKYGLELDNEGWTSIEALLDAIRRTGQEWSTLNPDDMTEMMETSSKQRHEIDGTRIRALYGHSLPDKIDKERADPPEYLFHGTSPAAWGVIQSEGLQPMRRQYVHLARDEATAVAVGRRKAADPIILRVRAGDAHEAGVAFSLGNNAVWLADAVPAEFIAIYSPDVNS